MRNALLATFLMLAGCATDPTEVMLVIDGEFDVPSEVDSLEIAILAPSDSIKTVTATLDADSGFPRIVGVLRGEGGDAEYTATITAKRGLSTVLTRHVTFRFRRDQVRMLQVHLLRACVGVSCSGSERTCGELGLCDRRTLETEVWDGPPPSDFVDAGKSLEVLVVGP